MRKTIKFTGTYTDVPKRRGQDVDQAELNHKEYDLDDLTQQSRLNSEKGLRVQVHEFSDGEDENPSNRKIGSVWLSLKK